MSAKPRNSELDLENRLAYRFSNIAAFSYRSIAGMLSERYGMTVAGWRAFSVIGAYQPISSGGVASRCSMDPDKVTRAVDRLAAKGFVARSVDPADRRRVMLTLTPRGRRAHDEIDEVRRRMDAEFLGAIPESERKALFATLDRLEQQARAVYTGRDTWRRYATPRRKALAKPARRSGDRTTGVSAA